MRLPRHVYKVAHLELDAPIHDRDVSRPQLKLEMHPLGTELPKDKQSRELHLRIGGSTTELDADGIAQLKEFLEVSLD